MSHEAAGVNEGASISQTTVTGPAPQTVESTPAPAADTSSTQHVVDPSEPFNSPTLEGTQADSHTNHPGAPLNQAEAMSGADTGAHGMAFPAGVTERAGGAISAEFRVDPPADAATNDMTKQRRYVASRLAKEAGNVIGRASDNIGLFGKGDVYHGTGILINVDTLDKVRVYDGWRFEGDDVFANSRDLTDSLTMGDVAKNLSGG